MTPYWLWGFCPPKQSERLAGGRWSDFTAATGNPLESHTLQPRVHQFSLWPSNFTVTWSAGFARSGFQTIHDLSQEDDAYGDEIALIRDCSEHNNEIRDSALYRHFGFYTEVPIFHSLECRPIIEQTNSRITVNSAGKVLMYELQNDPSPIEAPWKDVFVMHAHNGSESTKNITSRSVIIPYQGSRC